MTYRPYPNADRALAQLARHYNEYYPLAEPSPQTRTVIAPQFATIGAATAEFREALQERMQEIARSLAGARRA